MLTLMRKVGEVVCIGDTIKIKVLAVSPGDGRARQVKLGIDAPKDVRVARAEMAPPGPATPESQTEVAREGGDSCQS